MPYYLKRHIQYSHENPPKKHKCDFCNEEFKHIKKHVETCTKNINGKNLSKNYNCKLCEEKFVYRVNLRLHVKVVHKTQQKKKHICQTCKTEFKAKSNLRLHIKACHDEKRKKRENI